MRAGLSYQIGILLGVWFGLGMNFTSALFFTTFVLLMFLIQLISFKDKLTKNKKETKDGK